MINELDAETKSHYENLGYFMIEQVGLPLSYKTIFDFGLDCELLCNEAEKLKSILNQPPPAKRRDHATKIIKQITNLVDDYEDYKKAYSGIRKINLLINGYSEDYELEKSLFKLKSIFEKELIDAKTETITSNQYRYFIGEVLTGAFKMWFKCEPGYTINDKSVDSPFIRFATTILEAANVELLPASIAKAVTMKKQPEKRRKRVKRRDA